MSEQPGDIKAGMYWKVERIVVGHGIGMRPGDAKMETTVGIDLYCEGLDKPGYFVFAVDDAEAAANAMLDAVRAARAGLQ